MGTEDDDNEEDDNFVRNLIATHNDAVQLRNNNVNYVMHMTRLIAEMADTLGDHVEQLSFSSWSLFASSRDIATRTLRRDARALRALARQLDDIRGKLTEMGEEDRS